MCTLKGFCWLEMCFNNKDRLLLESFAFQCNRLCHAKIYLKLGPRIRVRMQSVLVLLPVNTVVVIVTQFPLSCFV